MTITLNGTTGVTTTGLTSNGIDDNATSTAITIDASENVGIGGTPDSGRKLHIEGGDATVGITLKDTAGSQFGINSDGGSLNFKSDSAGAVRMSISSTGVISGDGSGLTGISADISGGVASAGILINSTGSNFPIGCLILGSNTDSYINQAQAKNQKYGIQAACNGTTTRIRTYVGNGTNTANSLFISTGTWRTLATSQINNDGEMLFQRIA